MGIYYYAVSAIQANEVVDDQSGGTLTWEQRARINANRQQALARRANTASVLPTDVSTGTDDGALGTDVPANAAALLSEAVTQATTLAETALSADGGAA